MRKNVLFGLFAAVALPAAAMAQTGTAWLHVRVEEANKASKVSVNLPMTVVEAALNAAPEMIEQHGKVNLGEHGMKLEDFRRMWKQLAAVGDAEFVTVESEDQNVRIQRKGDIVQIFVDQKGGSAKAEAKPKAEAAKPEAEAAKPDAEKAPERRARRANQVRVEVPVSLVDALLSGEGDRVNIQAAVAALQKRRGDIVRVNDVDNQVRIWIDDQNTQVAAAR